MQMSAFLAEKRGEINERLEELKPLVDEYRRLEAARAALDGAVVAPVNGHDGDGAARNGDATGTNGRSSSGRSRPRGATTRRQQALAVVQANPGVTIPEIARIIGIQQNYLYRVLPTLVEDHLVEKRGSGWHLVEKP